MDYQKLGLRVGLEIHQQLASGSKLFCRCPIIKSDEFPLEINRKMIPVHSEMGEEDPAALFEYLRNRTFVYKYNTESSCLLELDECPPLSVNTNALRTALQISKLLNCNIFDEIYFMRKMVIDGSAVSSFQRTGLVAANGYIETSLGQVGIQTIGLEEDSAPAISKGNSVEYRLDRLGTPLVEVATDASIHSPEQAREVAEKIGSLLRALDVVRGIGSIRQDVNISIAGGARVEIKGFQELEKIPELVDNEVKRQLSLLELKDELHKRGFHELKEQAMDVTKLFAHTKCSFVKKAIEGGSHVHGMKVPRFAGLFAKECGDRTVGKEMSAYPSSHGFGIIHSDEDLGKYHLIEDFHALRKELDAGEEDLVLIVVGNGVEKAVYTLIKRIDYCLAGVPEETRIADGIGSKYARPLPGSGRLYPESDVPAILVTSDLRNVKIPKTLEERKEDFRELPDQMKEQLVKSPYYIPAFTLKKHGEVLVASLFLSNFTDLRRQGYDIDKLYIEKPGDFDYLLEKVSKGEVPKNAMNGILIETIGGVSIETACSKYSGIADNVLEDLVREVMKHSPEKSDSALIGIILAKTHGRADGRKVAELVKRLRA